MLDSAEKKFLEEKARQLRCSVVEMLAEAGSGHTAGSLGMADVFAALYFHILKHDSHKPNWSERDRLVLSNGHICPVLYAALAHAGHLPIESLKTLRRFGSSLQGHPHREFLPILETSSGPLGSGLSQAVGMALADRMDKVSSRYIFCLMSDGELDAGESWEAVMLAAKESLGGLIAVVDRNNIQIDGFTNEVMPLEPLTEKWQSWNWHTQVINGHDFKEIISAVGEAKAENKRPSVIIAKTVPGKGVPGWENDYKWHGKTPTKEEKETAFKILSCGDD